MTGTGGLYFNGLILAANTVIESRVPYAVLFADAHPNGSLQFQGSLSSGWRKSTLRALTASQLIHHVCERLLGCVFLTFGVC